MSLMPAFANRLRVAQMNTFGSLGIIIERSLLEDEISDDKAEYRDEDARNECRPEARNPEAAYHLVFLD